MNSIRSKIIVICFFCFSFYSFPQITFFKLIRSVDDQIAYSVQQTADEEYVLVGKAHSNAPYEQQDIYLIKTDQVGDTLWTRMFDNGPTNTEVGYCVQQTNDGGYIIAGWTPTGYYGETDIYLIKTDANGNAIWEKTIGGNSCYDEAYSVQQTDDNGFIVTGYTSCSGAGHTDIYLVKTDTNGEVTWTKTFGYSGFEYGYSVQQTFDGGYIIGGTTTSFGNNTSKIYLIKTNSLGSELWSEVIDESSYAENCSLIQTSDSGFAIGYGKYTDNGLYTDNFDFCIIKTDDNGNTVWIKTIGGSGNDFAKSIDQTDDNGYIVAGRTNSFGNLLYDIYLVKTNSYGDTLWTRILAGSYYTSIAYSVQQTFDGGYVIGGGVEEDVCLIKTNELGIVTNLLIEPQIPEAYTLSQNYPNPFNLTTTIEYEIPNPGQVVLKIFNTMGQLIATIVNETQSAGRHKVKWNAANISTGVYFYRLENCSFADTKKLLLLK
jgi:hypothetical protein